MWGNLGKQTNALSATKARYVTSNVTTCEIM
jgi:hypothetical protein